MSKGAVSVSWVEIMCTSSAGMPMAWAAIWTNTVSPPWPISVAPSWSCTVPSWLSTMRAEAVSREMGYTPVL